MSLWSLRQLPGPAPRCRTGRSSRARLYLEELEPRASPTTYDILLSERFEATVIGGQTATFDGTNALANFQGVTDPTGFTATIHWGQGLGETQGTITPDPRVPQYLFDINGSYDYPVEATTFQAWVELTSPDGTQTWGGGLGTFTYVVDESPPSDGSGPTDTGPPPTLIAGVPPDSPLQGHVKIGRQRDVDSNPGTPPRKKGPAKSPVGKKPVAGPGKGSKGDQDHPKPGHPPHTGNINWASGAWQQWHVQLYNLLNVAQNQAAQQFRESRSHFGLLRKSRSRGSTLPNSARLVILFNPDGAMRVIEAKPIPPVLTGGKEWLALLRSNVQQVQVPPYPQAPPEGGFILDPIFHYGAGEGHVGFMNGC